MNNTILPDIARIAIMRSFQLCNPMREQCFQLLRKQLKSEHGKGWGVRAMRGKVQLTLRVDESAGMKNPRNSVSLPLDWSADK